MIHPLPSAVADVDIPVREVSDGWEYCAAGAAKWNPIVVPGEPAMQGFDVIPDRPAHYRVTVQVPTVPEGYRHLLRFTSVYSRARVLIDGAEVGSHDGGFTSWELDVTARVAARRVEVKIEVVDCSDDLSWGSGYAKHPIGGILGPVHWVVLPPEHLTRLDVETRLQDGGRATVAVGFDLMDGAPGEDLSVAIALHDPDGHAVATADARPSAGSVELEVPDPALWDAEHPRLHALRVRLCRAGVTIESTVLRIGIREVRRIGNQLLVNGRSVHLRGVNRHNIHPTLGRTSTGALDRRDAELFKAANVNFVRTSHYPPHPSFLEAADELGLYVEDEAPACFMGTHGNGLHQFDAERRGEFVAQAQEMIDRDRNHPSVILWSLGNESIWGPGYAAELDAVRASDDSRPVIFSYPDWVSSDGWERRRHHVRTDILSVHYAGWQEQEPEPLGRSDIPVLHDEYAHVPCYDTAELGPDPAVRVAWGEGFIRAADQLRRTDGALGCAIWAGIDEIFELPAATVGYGQWGIIDVHRRPKPEYAFVARAFSPIEVMREAVERDDDDVVVPLFNWFDHTDLDEVELEWQWDGGPGDRVRIPSTPPRGTARVRIPSPPGRDDVNLLLRFSVAGRVVDEDVLVGISSPRRTMSDPPAPLNAWSFGLGHGAAPTVREHPGRFEVRTGDAVVVLSRATGLIESVRVADRVILRGSPRLWLDPAMGFADWRPARPVLGLTAQDIRSTAEGLEVIRSGAHGDVAVRYRTVLGRDGRIAVEATLLSDPPYVPRTVTEPGIGFREAGMLWSFGHATELTWRRRGTWVQRSEDDLGRLSGRVELPAEPRDRPLPRSTGDCPWSWEVVERDPAIDADAQPVLSRDARASRHRVEHAELGLDGGSVVILGAGQQSVRVARHTAEATAVVVASAGLSRDVVGELSDAGGPTARRMELRDTADRARPSMNDAITSGSHDCCAPAAPHSDGSRNRRPSTRQPGMGRIGLSSATSRAGRSGRSTHGDSHRGDGRASGASGRGDAVRDRRYASVAVTDTSRTS